MTRTYHIRCPNYSTQKIQHGQILYATGTLPLQLKTYDDALNPALWAQHHQPFSAIIAHDSGTELVIVRDHLGLEPMYVSHAGRPFHVYAAPNLPTLFSLLPQTPVFDNDELTRLFSTSHLYSDNTLYQGVFRVEPGHFLHFNREGCCTKKAFWALTPQGETLVYQNPEEYVEHFSLLLKEAIEQTIPANASVAAEFSAGLDSTSVYCAAHACGLRPKLFMHGTPPNSDAEKRYQTKYEKAFFETYPNVSIERIQAVDFDLLSIFDKYAAWFQGPAPYLFFMFAHPIHRAVSEQGYSILLSGFGGDQGVSSPMTHNFFIPELMAQKNYKEIWQEIFGARQKTSWQKLRSLITCSQYLHPKIHQSALFAKKVRAELHNLFCRGQNQVVTDPHPYLHRHYKTVREAEYTLLQGEQSHEIRMRIEYSSLVSKQMGFEYRYPLLYPKLLEFFVSLPLSQKRHQCSGRYLIRRYLKQFFPHDIFSGYLKKEGLDIVPATMTHYQDQFTKGQYAQAFQNLPYEHLISPTPHPIRLRHSIKGYMLKPFHSPE